MENYYYFLTSLETVDDLETDFPDVHSNSRRQISPSPRPRRVPRDAAGELQHHYLDACFRCGRILAGNKDIFMYRGDTPFCSEECRQQQIETDEAREKRSKQPAAVRRERQRQRQRQRRSPQRIPVWAR